MSYKDPKHPLSIHLTEPVVFLRGSHEAVAGRRRHDPSETPPAMLRGLLTLHLTKPTRVSSIEVMLEGKSMVQWFEGTGPRRVEVPEEQKILKAHAVFFNANTCGVSTRSASLGPSTRRPGNDGDDNEPVAESRPSTAQTSRSWRPRLSLGDTFIQASPGLSVPPPDRRNSADLYGWQHSTAPLHTTATLTTSHPPTPPASPPYTPGRSSATFIELASVSRPRTPADPHLESSPQDLDPRGFRTEESPGHMLEEFRNALRMETGSPIYPAPSRMQSGPSIRSTEPFLVTIDDSAWSSRSTAGGSPRSDSAPASRSASRDAESREARPPLSRSVGKAHGRTTPPSTTPTSLRSHRASLFPQDQEHDPSSQGRHPSPWSLSNMTSVFKDVKDRVRNHSPMDTDPRRGRTPERGVGTSYVDLVDAPEEHEHERRQRDKERKSTLGKLTAAVRLDDAPAAGGWKEFRKGTYTYPISFAIPSDTPPTIHCDYGTVTYRLKAVVHRPGALTTKFAISTEVILVACPPDDGTEDTHPIVVERQWDSQLRYIITLGGRSFPIGAHVPFSLTMVPLEKCKIYRLSVFLEEKAQYDIRSHDSVREQPIKRFELLSIRNADKNLLPILPLSPKDCSLFTPYLDTSTLSSSADEALSSLMGPGPWVLNHELQIPAQCGRIHYTYKHKVTQMSISHVLKIVFRVERGDDTFVDPRTGKRRLFDIVVQTPIHILSCHCSRERISLPRYSLFAGVNSDYTPMHTCACSGWNVPGIGISGPSGANSRPSTANAFTRTGTDMPLMHSVSGQEGSRGGAPPEYTEAHSQGL